MKPAPLQIPGGRCLTDLWPAITRNATLRRRWLSVVEEEATAVRAEVAARQADRPKTVRSPSSAQHRTDLLAVVDATSGVPSIGDLSPWRTPAEAQWTDAELRNAANLWRKGVRRPELRVADLAYRRILKRRIRSLKP